VDIFPYLIHGTSWRNELINRDIIFFYRNRSANNSFRPNFLAKPIGPRPILHDTAALRFDPHPSALQLNNSRRVVDSGPIS
jgi:hypothetical protein